MDYQYTMRYTYDDLLALNIVSGKTYRKWRSRIVRLLCLLLGGFLLLTSALMIACGEPFSQVIFPVTVGALALLVGIFYHRVNALQSRRMMVKTAGEGTVALSDTEFTEQTSLGTASHPYSAFLSVIRYRGRLFLFVDKRHAYILPDERMTVGDPTGVDAFLEEKCGKPVRVLR